MPRAFDSRGSFQPCHNPPAISDSLLGLNWSTAGIIGVAPVAFPQPVQQTGRLGLRLALHEGPASVLAGTTAQEAHQAGCAGGRAAEHRLAKLPTHRERLGQGSGSEAGGRENAPAARGHRDDLERLRRSRHGCQAAHSAAPGGVRQRAGESVRRGVSHRGCLETEAGYSAVSFRDPYLTHVWFRDFPQAEQKNGSSGRTRTYNPSVN